MERVSCFFMLTFPKLRMQQNYIVTPVTAQILLIASSSAFTSRWVYTRSVSVMAPE